jgi:single-stranded-DNA-specific exonuclease
MDKEWNIKPSGDPEVIARLAEELNIDQVLANLLVQRHVTTFDEARIFFRPDMAHLHDPFLMKDMDKAVARIDIAFSQHEKILIYGDYDVDGTTSVALVYSFMKEHYPHLDYYIPDRYNEGYGISFKGIDYAKEHGVTLIISLDCGIKAIDKVEYATAKGIDFIICDHHTVGSKIPAAVAVLDPKRPDCGYPYKELSACGVGFKLVQAICIHRNIPDDNLVGFLDLVVVSIASDIVPITGENRILAFFGLQQLNNTPRKGLAAIVRTSGIENKDITVSDCVFKIGPRINAAGRIATGKKAVDLLISGDVEMAKQFSQGIDELNEKRKNLDRQITEEALALIELSEKQRKRKSTVLFKSDWHKGVIGIVASRLTESYYRPTVILTESNGYATGSARSVLGFNLYDAIDSCADLLEGFGGHMYAAGLTLKKEKVPAFTERFEAFVEKHITAEQLIPKIEIDASLEFSSVSAKFYRILRQFAPFGPGNMAPVFLTESVVDYGTSRKVGKKGEHLKLEITQHTRKPVVVPAIAFNQSKHYEQIAAGKSFDVCYTIEENEFMGKVSLQLMVKDLQVSK